MSIILLVAGLYWLFKFKIKIYSVLFWIVYKVLSSLAILIVIVGIITNLNGG